MFDWLAGAWPYVVTLVAIVLGTATAVHAILFRRDARAATLWVGLSLLAPIVGAVLYFFLGINRVRRKAGKLREGLDRVLGDPCVSPLDPEQLGNRLPKEFAHLEQLQRMIEEVVVRPLVPGNDLVPLENGDAAYPEMLAAIDGAETSVTLCSYIFNADVIGERFVRSLGDAVRRGVQVRVLVDEAGRHYSWPRITKLLRRARVPHARFHLRTGVPGVPNINLRNHRKTCVVDGRIGFTGGMNIKQGHVLSESGGSPVQDLHFRVEGPVVAQLQEVFAEDWAFTTQERLVGDVWFPTLSSVGRTPARAIADGPDEDLDKLRWTLLGALSVARSSIRVVTPYFLPDVALISALNVASMRGVEVDILIPEKVNVPFVQWATRATVWQVLEHDCRVFLTAPPFEHTKLVLVDDCWVLLGSANWDARSLRLNFELNLEAYDPTLAADLMGIVDRKKANARRLTLAEIDGRPVRQRLRDGVARLFSPVL